MVLRDRLKFHGDAKEESLEGGEYVLRHQTIDDRKHPDEIKADGDLYSLLVEVLHKGVLTYQGQYGFRDNFELRIILDGMRSEIQRGEHSGKG
jgi:hypothetical protein